MLRKAFGGLWRPKNPHSLDHLKYLHSVLSKNQTVNESNKSLLVETIRSIAEILIWGDQNDSSVFDFFLERNMHSFFLKFMDQKTGNNYVCVQLLQTLNILFENIRNETSIYYLLSNNHVNSIIIHKFDFSDEEVMAYYISFLKTLSFRLNQHTIHFFYNEHTNDFPLYTEAIKFFNHSESMVRIAVRTLSLNVYRVKDERMLKFVTDKTAAPYFSNLVWFIGNHILEIDDCVRNDADHKSMNKLRDVVAEHLDHLYYINDILSLNIASLNRVLSDHLLNRLFIPLYIYSFARNSIPTEDMKPYVSPVVALFLLCQVFLIITHVPLVRLLAWIIIAGDMEVFTERGATLYATSPRRKGMVKPSFMAPPEPLDKLLAKNILSADSDSDSDSEPELPVSSSVSELTKLPSPFHVPGIASPDPSLLSITDEEKQLLLSEASFSLENRPFLSALFSALDYSDNDYFQLFSLCLIYAMQVNTGINKELLESIQIPSKNSQELHFYNKTLVEKMIQLASAGCQYDSRVRLVTLEILITSLQMILIRDDKSILMDEHFAEVEGAREESTLILRNFYKSEEIFLDMFEDEFREMNKKPLNFEFVMSDASLLLPPTGTPLTGIDFRKRLPCGEVEKTRKAIRTFFLLRKLSLSLQGLKETSLPLSNPDSFVQAGDVLDLNNSDLLAVTVVSKDGTRQRRFLVVDLMQLILIEPDGHRLGWGVAKFSGFLQDLEVTSDKDDSRCLYVTVHKPSSGNSKGTPTPLLSAAFTFDDHIRCMAAKQRLTKGRTKARQRKMHLIAKLLELPTTVGTACPSPPHHTLSSLRQGVRTARRARMGSGSNTPANSPRHSVDTGGPSGSYRPLFNANLRVPGAAAMVRAREAGRVSPRRSRERSLSREASPVMESEGIRMEPIPRNQEVRGHEGEAQEAQEETSFEAGTTWYVGEGAEGGPTEDSSCVTDSPRRGAVHDV
eukprot:GFUD01021398.1.p1 GENE.GFUD01021398.1~~GFUD01021398.1.p1  ORF type:complete len:960 (-),score=279.18 GFUD01021398.1:290-3169(-)